jgi:hypothetical protein
MQCTTSTASRTGGSIYDILSTTSSVDRKIYGINVVSTDNAANPIKLFINDGTYRILISNVNIPANSGNNVSTSAVNVMTSTMGEAALCKNRDMNGIPYFNLPKNWKMEMSYATTPGAGESIYTFVYGEYY